MAILQSTNKIEATPGTVGGQPRIAGTRFTVKQIVVWHEYMGMGADEIATEYEIQLSDIYAALSYFFDHREDILRSIQAEKDL
ncbi:MAG: DUF433 domain-containing protein, partial [Saprospiraceae bacterium]